MQGAGDEMRLSPAEPALELDRRLSELPHLQHLPAPRRLEDAQRPVLPVTLGGDHPGIDRVQRVLVPVAGRQDPTPEHVRQARLRVAAAIEVTALRGQDDLQRAPEVKQLVGQPRLRKLKREPAHLAGGRVRGLPGGRLDLERLPPPSGHAEAVVERGPQLCSQIRRQ